ncbi:MAG: DUF1559 domain-containing protein [Planctomycetota bacterium]|nr:MAG: DUF1559 domain-containing protein [Planctomycetota bacterium]REJ95349.1 MAG: DUF1559 domain-containing protein [Planctomycetota bacterium]REK24232.1 MAG: DUF1559 domain-containing protein [Planctomycetota bacterium]REK28848.1 MAG: DUF1559 domain-containing protein [Planctomycetota bacterium]
MTRTPARRDSGFTLLEVVLVLALILVALALLLPALGDARLAARRTQCMNNARQIGLAMQNYHDVYRLFPPGYVARDVAPSDPAEKERGPGYAWAAMLLPYIDQAALAGTIDFSADPISNAAAPAIATYRCASDPDPMMSYVGCAGLGSLTESPGAPSGPGIFYRNSFTSVFDVTDGTTHTILIGERAQTHDFVPGELPVPAGAVWLAATPGELRPAGVEQPFLESSASLVLGNVGQDEPFSVSAAHCRTNHVASFSSSHPGGAVFVMADSSTHFLSDDIDVDLYRQLGQRSDGMQADVPDW